MKRIRRCLSVVGVKETDLLELSQARCLVASGATRSIRVAAGLSLRDVASTLGVAPSTVLRWERGEQVPGKVAGPAYARLLQALVEGR
jgi:DNA-binding transcriptional regulator YiaG